MASHARAYDLVVLGATGYTGKLTAQYIAKSFSTNLAWAIAGRSESKLSTIAKELKTSHPDRTQPAVEVTQLNEADLTALANKTKLLITTVGPYHKYGSPVLEACAKNGTHYLDVTGEIPWTVEMTRKYHETAKKSGAIVIPQCGLESVPADLMAYAVSRELRTHSLTAAEMLYTVHAIKGGLSGGTQATVLSLFDNYSLLDVAKAGNPASMCPTPVSQVQPKPTLFQRLFGVRTEAGLGTITTSMVGRSDLPIVYRSWGLLKDVESYGPNFSFRPYMTVRSAIIGALIHITAHVAPLILAFPPLRWLLKRFALASGEGPSAEDGKAHFFEVRGLAIPDQTGKGRAFGRIKYVGGIYEFTAITVAEAARTILSKDEFAARRLGGGVMTPATLGQPYLERLAPAGIAFETKMMDS